MEEIRNETTNTELNENIDTELNKKNEHQEGKMINESKELKQAANEIENREINKPFRIPFYKENHKSEKKGIKIWHLILISFMSAILGGGVVFTAFQFVAPALKPSIESVLGNVFSDNSEDASLKETVSNPIIIEATDTPIAAIAAKVSPSVVSIRVTAKMTNWFLGTTDYPVEGSGIIISEDGYIMTNEHVIENAFESYRGLEMVEGATIEVILPSDSDKSYPATVVGRDDKTDLAVLKIDAKGLPEAELGDSDNLKVGDPAIAIGNPVGYMGSVTAGIISGLDRTIETSDGKQLNLIQTDAAINFGNSGGALVNSQGQVIGINTIKVAASGYEGLGFAIPINSAKEITSNLIEYTYVKNRPFLGISADLRFTEEFAKQNDVPMGVLVMDVLPLSGAYKAGLKIGDIITKFDGVAIENFDALEEQKNKHIPEDQVEIEVYRDGETLTLQVTLSEDKG